MIYVLGRGTRQHAFKLCVPVGMVCAAKAILLDQWLVAVLSNLWTQLQHDVQDWYRCGVAIKICQVSPSDCWQLWSSSGHGIGDLGSGIPDPRSGRLVTESGNFWLLILLLLGNTGATGAAGASGAIGAIDASGARSAESAPTWIVD